MPDRKMKLKKPLWFGLALAPLATPVLYAIWALLFWSDSTPKHDLSGFTSYAITAWMVVFAALTIFSYFISAVFGISLITILRRFNKLSFWWLVLPSTLFGAVAFVGVFFLLLTIADEFKGVMWLEILRFSSVGGVFGFSISALFCLLVGIKRHSS